MHEKCKRPLHPIPLAALAAVLLLGFPAAAGAVGVVVNGVPVQFDQPPVERDGRVFVPLRGVFERLGASVVYSGGVIDATGNGRVIQLHIGSTQALIDGQPTYLDVAPFIIGSRTLVPLRFVSQALGAHVDYDYGTQIVSVTVPVTQVPAAAPPPPPPTPRPFNTVLLRHESPANTVNVPSRRPAISAAFSQQVDPNSVRITLDGRDVTTDAYVSPHEFQFTPAYDLPSQRHDVQVTGKTTAGFGFSRAWWFVSGTSVVHNYVNSITPVGGAKVGSTFTISGMTLPYAHVRIVAQGSEDIGGIFRIGTGSFVGETTADQYGYFSQAVQVPAPSGSTIGVRIISTQPSSQAAAVADVIYTSV